MYRYKNLLIGMNLTDHDIPIIKYAGKISHMANSQNAYFLHVALNQDIPENIKKDFPGVVESIPVSAKQKQEETIREYFDGNPNTETANEIVERKWLISMLHMI